MMSYEDPALSYEADLTRQRDELAAALRKIAEWDHPSHPNFGVDGTQKPSVEAFADLARAALAKVPQ